MDVDIKILRPLLRFAYWCTSIQSLRRTWKMPCHSIATKFPRHYSTVNSEITNGKYSNPDESKKTIVLDGNNLTQLTIGCLDLSIELVETPTDASKIIISFGEAQNSEILECQDKQSKQSEELKQVEPLKQHSKELNHSKEFQLAKKCENLKIKDFIKEQMFSKELDALYRFKQSFNSSNTKEEDKQILDDNTGNSKSSDLMLKAKKFQNIKVCLAKDSVENSNANEARDEYTVSGISIGINCDQMYKPTDTTASHIITNKISTNEPPTEGQSINATASHIITNKISTNEPPTKGQPITGPMVKESPYMGRAETQTQTEEETPGLYKAKAKTPAQTQEALNTKLTKRRFDHEYIRKQLFQSYPTYITTESPKTESECVNTSNNENSRLLKKIFQNLDTKEIQSEKVSIVGLGQVGISTAAFILQKGLTNNLALMDLRRSWVESEALDFLHGSSFLNNPTITADSDGRNTKNSKYIIITVGLRQVGISTMEFAQETTAMLKNLIPGLVAQSPNATFIIASSPSDVMAWVAHKVGKIPPHRCISLGCHLDTARFKYYIAKRLNVATSCVDGYIIGEHGESSVPVWSSVTVGGISLHKVVPYIGTKDDCQDWSKVHQQVVDGAKAVCVNKGYTNWAVALSITDILEKMQENSGRIVSVGTNVKGTNCIRDPVYLSLPSMVSPNGITRICKLPLSDWETERLLKSAEVLMRKQCAIKL